MEQHLNLLFGIMNLFTASLVTLVCFPLLNRSVKMNNSYGFRFKQAYQSEEAWYKINRHGAIHMILYSYPRADHCQYWLDLTVVKKYYFAITFRTLRIQMKTKLIRIGNSRGIRIPKALLDQCHLKETVELETQNGCLTIRPVGTPREGWAEAFRQMAEAGDDTLLDQDTLPASEWDETEWEW